MCNNMLVPLPLTFDIKLACIIDIQFELKICCLEDRGYQN